jgi:YbgC/YbaW family acyl-CoA thioester hydrolase
MTTPFVARRRVEFCDTDMAGMMHFANYLRFMESAECEFWRSIGLSVAWQTGGERLGFPRVSASCDYARPARFEDVLDIMVTVKAIGTKSVTFGFEFARSGEVLARGTISAVCCRATRPGQALESIPIPDDIRAKLESARGAKSA